MNILFLSDYFSWFYTDIEKQLQKKGIGITLYYACIKSPCYLESDKNTVCLQENDLNKKKSIETLQEFIAEKEIQIIMNPHRDIKTIDKLLKSIRLKYPHIKLISLWHNTPGIILQNKRQKLREASLKQASLKTKIQLIFPELYLKFLAEWIVKPIFVKILTVFDVFVVLSPLYIDECVKLAGKKGEKFRDKIVAIPNPRKEYTSQIQPCSKAKEIVYVGRHSEEKSLHRLLIIWNKIQNSLIDWKLRIVGDGPEKVKWEKLASSLQLQRVIFTGKQEHTVAINTIDLASILCLVSNAEGLPGVFIEAMSVGTVPVGFNSFSAIYEMIDNWKNGVIVQSFNLDEYADALIKLALDKDLRITLAENAMNKVKQYNIDRVSDMWLDLFRKILKA
jgi:glycosyltransferase involved in cell wall biosynthesis